MSDKKMMGDGSIVGMGLVMGMGVGAAFSPGFARSLDSQTLGMALAIGGGALLGVVVSWLMVRLNG
jgi:hypothetical protein